MEGWQMDLITRNLPELVGWTKWNTTISTTLTSKSILSINDIDSLDTCFRSRGAMSCAELLYSTLFTRTNGFEAVASALHKAKQTGAFNILLKECLAHLSEQKEFILPQPVSSNLWMHKRNIVSPKIFDYFVADLLVFKGIEYDELCSFIKCGQGISKEWEKSDYLILQDGNDFNEICQKVNLKRNVHLLEFRRDSGNFLLLQSRGHVFNICHSLLANELDEPLSTSDFFSNVTFDSKLRLVECDFWIWPNFLDELEKNDGKSVFGFLGWNADKVTENILKHKVKPTTAEELVGILLDCGEQRVKWFLAGRQTEQCHLVLGILGKVEEERLHLVNEVIHQVCSEIEQIRVWLLTCSDVCRLERGFRIWGWRMQGKQDVELQTDTEVVRPSPAIQCEYKLLARVFPNENPYFSTPPLVNWLRGRNVGEGHVADICGEILTHCANTLAAWLGAESVLDIQLELMKIGFRTLFPAQGDIFLGGAHSFGQISFISKDIAAYSVAKLLVDDRYSSHFVVGKMVEFVRNEVFKLDLDRGFKNYRVCYFLEHFLGKGGVDNFLQIIQNNIDVWTQTHLDMQIFIGACILGKCANLLKIDGVAKKFFKFCTNSTTTRILELAVAFGNISILKNINETMISVSNKFSLRLSAQRGDASVVSLVLGGCYCPLEMPDYSDLLRSCVENSCFDSDPIISQKKNIVDQFLKEMESKNMKQSGSILHARIHFQLLKHLIHVRVVDMNDIKFQNAICHFTPGEFHELVLYLASTDKTNCFKIVDRNGWSALHQILRNLEILPETLDILKAHNVDFTIISKDDLSLLTCATMCNQSATVVKKLVDCGADPNCKNKYGNGLLHLAAFYSNFSSLGVLHAAGCDMNQRNIFGFAPTHLVFIGDSKENLVPALNLLLRSGADVDCKDASGSTPLFWAVTKCKHDDDWLNGIHFLVKEWGAKLSVKDNDGQNIVHRAASQCSSEQYHDLVQWIRDNSSDISVLKDKCDFQCSPLHYAVFHLELLETTLNLLLDYVNINDVDKHGNSVLMYAIRGGRKAEFLNMLIRNGADWRKHNFRHFTVLHQAAKYGNEGGLELFIEKGCDVNSVTVDSETPLHVAFQKEHAKVPEVVAILLRHNLM